MREGSKKFFFNADSRKSNADKRRFIHENICDHLRAPTQSSKLVRVGIPPHIYLLGGTICGNLRLRYFLIGLIKSYRSCFSSLIPSACRFYPSCSSYSLESIERFGILKGLIKTFLRIGRCHPFSKGGYDPVR